MWFISHQVNISGCFSILWCHFPFQLLFVEILAFCTVGMLNSQSLFRLICALKIMGGKLRLRMLLCVRSTKMQFILEYNSQKTGLVPRECQYCTSSNSPQKGCTSSAFQVRISNGSRCAPRCISTAASASDKDHLAWAVCSIVLWETRLSTMNANHKNTVLSKRVIFISLD